MQAQVQEGRALPLAEKQAAFQVARARQMAEELESERATAETALAMALGFPAEDRVHPVEEQRLTDTFSFCPPQIFRDRVDEPLSATHLTILAEKTCNNCKICAEKVKKP